MFKKLMISTAAAALVAGSAIAQTPQTTTPPAKAPGATTMPQAGAPAGNAQFVTMQGTDQWLASNFRGTDVMGANDEKIGDVSDVLFDKSGRVLAYIVGVGGFLGIGQKDVAIAPASFQMMAADTKAGGTANRDDVRLKLSMTKDELKNAPEFKTTSTARTAPTTGQAPRERAPAPATPPAAR